MKITLVLLFVLFLFFDFTNLSIYGLWGDVFFPIALFLLALVSFIFYKDPFLRKFSLFILCFFIILSPGFLFFYKINQISSSRHSHQLIYDTQEEQKTYGTKVSPNGWWVAETRSWDPHLYYSPFDAGRHHYFTYVRLRFLPFMELRVDEREHIYKDPPQHFLWSDESDLLLSDTDTYTFSNGASPWYHWKETPPKLTWGYGFIYFSITGYKIMILLGYGFSSLIHLFTF